jgi:LacI family transcriptional regulator
MREKNVTIKDIAAVLGLSPSTVSRALNNYSDINLETRDKVIKAAKEMNYTPNFLARSLVTNETKRIGLFIENYDEEHLYGALHYDILISFKKSVLSNGYEVILLSTTSEEQRRIPFERIMAEKQLAGAFIMGLRTDDEYLKEIQKTDYPVVLFDIPVKKPNIGYVSVNSMMGAELAMQHLIGLGHKKIGYVNGHRWAYVSQERFNGYLLTLTKNQLFYDPSLVFEGDFSEESGRKAAEYFAQKDITAIFAASDMMAIGMIKKFEELGIRVPEDISIVGFDDVHLASYITPALTTIRQNKSELGKAAAVLLTNLIAKQELHQVILEPELIIRQSTDKPKY